MLKTTSPQTCETKLISGNTLAVFLVFLCFYLLLFLQFPLRGALPGNIDTLFSIAFSNTYLSKAWAFFNGDAIGSAMYPVKNVLTYGECSPGSAAIFIFFRLLGLDHLWSYYFCISLIFALNGLGVYILSRLFMSAAAAFCAGFAFSCTNMFFAHMDDATILSFFLPCLALFFFYRYIRGGKRKDMLASGLCAGLQAYFSMYVFVYQSIALIICLITALIPSRHKVLSSAKATHILMGALACLFVSAPIIMYYFSLHLYQGTQTYVSLEAIPSMSLQLFSPFYVLPNNLFYKVLRLDVHNMQWVMFHYRAFTGILIWIMAAYALIKQRKNTLAFLLIALAGLILAIGPKLSIGARQFSTPIGYLYENFELIRYLRVPVRAYFLVGLAISILAGMGIDLLIRKKPAVRVYPLLIAALFISFHFLENTSFPLPSFKAGRFLQLPNDYRSYLSRMGKEVILDLPSDLRISVENWDDKLLDEPITYAKKGKKLLLLQDCANDYTPLFYYNREIFYMNWQTEHRKNIVGGANGFISLPRMIYQQQVKRIAQKEALLWLRDRGDVTLIAFHKDMVLPGEEKLLSQLEDSPYLEKAFEGEQTVIFRYKDRGGK